MTRWRKRWCLPQFPHVSFWRGYWITVATKHLSLRMFHIPETVVCASVSIFCRGRRKRRITACQHLKKQRERGRVTCKDSRVYGMDQACVALKPLGRVLCVHVLPCIYTCLRVTFSPSEVSVQDETAAGVDEERQSWSSDSQALLTGCPGYTAETAH